MSSYEQWILGGIGVFCIGLATILHKLDKIIELLEVLK